MLDRLYTWYWILWLGLGFLVPEVSALVSRHPERTLSETVWRWEGLGGDISRYYVFAFLVWLTLHMTFRILR